MYLLQDEQPHLFGSKDIIHIGVPVSSLASDIQILHGVSLGGGSRFYRICILKIYTKSLEQSYKIFKFHRNNTGVKAYLHFDTNANSQM